MEFILEIIYLKNKGWGIVIKFDEYADVGSHWIALYASSNDTISIDVLDLNRFLKRLKI